MLRSRRFWIGVVVSTVFLALFFWQVEDFVEMGRALATANYVFLIPALLVYLVGVWFRAVRWHYLLYPLGNFASHRLFPLVVIGFMVNNIMPGRLGIVARAYILGERESISKMSIAATIATERVFDGLALLSFLVVISLFVPLADWARTIVWVMTIVFVGSLVLLLLITFFEDATRRVAGVLFRLLPQRWKPQVAEWLDLALYGLRVLRSPGKLLAVSIASLLVWLCEGSMFYLISLSFDLQQPFYVMLLVTAIASLAWALIFVAPGGVGPFNYFCQQAIILFGVPTALATAYVGVLHAMIILPMIVLGLIFLWMNNLSLAKLVPKRRQERLAQDYEESHSSESQDEE